MNMLLKSENEYLARNSPEKGSPVLICVNLLAGKEKRTDMKETNSEFYFLRRRQDLTIFNFLLTHTCNSIRLFLSEWWVG